MTPEERAENIFSEMVINSTGPHNWKGDKEKCMYSVSREALSRLEESIAAQICEAEKEAYLKGRESMQEEAAEIAASCECCDPSCNHFDIAREIRLIPLAGK